MADPDSPTTRQEAGRSEQAERRDESEEERLDRNLIEYVTLLLTAISSICLIAPSARHRMRFRELDKHWIVDTGNKLAIAGLLFEAGAICGVLMLITHVVYDSALTAVVVTAFAALFAWVWFIAPVVREFRDDD